MTIFGDILGGLVDTSVGADPGTNHCVENLRWCSLHRRGRSASRGQTVHACAGAAEFVGGA
jgi:hypothetical protein